MRALLRFTIMHREHVIKVKCIEPAFPTKKGGKFNVADDLFKGALISVLTDNIVDVYMDLPTGKAMCDVLMVILQ